MQAYAAVFYSFGRLIQTVYIADIFDVTIIALFAYSLLVLFKQTRSLPTLVGIGILILFYIAARTFNLFLTSLLLRAFFDVFLIVIVILFQEELRRFFELIASWSTRQKKERVTAIVDNVFFELLQAVKYFADQRIGALIIIPGYENIERHIEGGRILDGIISEELLVSIFDPTSPGHDGAVIIRKGRIIMFGAHLPLSTNFKEIGKRGTRHSAALGISERSDALTVVVSEETGSISIARNGDLKKISDVHELGKQLNVFLKEKFPDQAYRWWDGFIRHNTLEKAIAVLLAGALWLLIAYPSEIVQRDFVLPIIYRNVPENTVIESSAPKTVAVTLAGRGDAALDKIDIRELAVSIDGALLSTRDNLVVLQDDDIIHPSGTSILHIKPDQIRVLVTKFNKMTLPIRVTTFGKSKNGLHIARIEPSPAVISLLLPQDKEAPQFITTEPITMDTLSDNIVVPARLILPAGAQLASQMNASISVTITFEKR